MIRSLFPVVALLLSGMGWAGAATTDEACSTLMDVRGSLLAMLDSTEKTTRDGFKRQVYSSSAQLESILAELVDSDNARAKAFKPVWESFKRTREQEIIPAVYAGKYSKAKSIASGIQSERMDKMKSVMGCK